MIKHQYSQTVADGTATSVVRPSDWNSAHSQVWLMAGNTSGASSLSGTDIVLQGGNNITLSAIQGAGIATLVISAGAGGGGAGVGYTSTTQAGSTVGVTHSTNGLSMAWPPFITAGGGGGGAVIQGSGNTTGTMNTYSTGTVVLAAGSNLTLSQSSNTMSFIGPNASSLVGGVGVTLASAGSTISINAVAPITLNQWEPNALVANSSFSSFGQNTLHFMGVRPTGNVSMSAIEMMVSLSSATSSVSHAVSQTISYGWYSKGTGASTSQYASMATSSFTMGASYSSNLSGGYSIGAGANSASASSAGTVFGSVLSGQKLLSLPMATTLSAGGDYLFCWANSTSSVGNTGALRASFAVMTEMTNGSFGGMGTSGIAASNVSVTAAPYVLQYTATSNAWPATVARSQLNQMSMNKLYLNMEA